MQRRLTGTVAGPILVLALGLAGLPRAEADAIYTVKDLGDAGSDPYERASLAGGDLLRVDRTGAVSTAPSNSSAWGAKFPVPGLGSQVFAPGTSEDGRYVAGTLFESTEIGRNPWVAFYAHDGLGISLGRPQTADGYSAAYGVNDAGQVVGTSSLDGRQTLAFVATPGKGTVSLGTLGGPSSTALGINNSGLVVGQSSLADGTSYGSPRAFVDGGKGLVDLNTLVSPDSGFLLTSASGVNDAGQIAAYGKDSSGADHILLLTPAQQAVPEPGPLALFGIIVATGILRHDRGGRHI